MAKKIKDNPASDKVGQIEVNKYIIKCTDKMYG